MQEDLTPEDLHLLEQSLIETSTTPFTTPSGLVMPATDENNQSDDTLEKPDVVANDASARTVLPRQASDVAGQAPAPNAPPDVDGSAKLVSSVFAATAPNAPPDVDGSAKVVSSVPGHPTSDIQAATVSNAPDVPHIRSRVGQKDHPRPVSQAPGRPANKVPPRSATQVTPRGPNTPKENQIQSQIPPTQLHESRSSKVRLTKLNSSRCLFLTIIEHFQCDQINRKKKY